MSHKEPVMDSENFEALVVELRDDLSFANRQGRGLGHLIEVREESRFFNIGENEYRFLCQLDGKRNLREAFDEYCKIHRDRSTTNIFSWENATQLFKFLLGQNLVARVNGRTIAVDDSQDAGQIVKNVNPYGFRIKLFDADSIASGLSAQLGWLFHRIAFWVWTFIAAVAILIALGNWKEIVADTKTVIQPENWMWLTLCWVFLKIIHESSHAICCKRFGGVVGESGVNFLLFLPMPYVDVSSSWKFESKWHRIYVALAGVYAELFVASVFVFVWALSRPDETTDIRS